MDHGPYHRKLFTGTDYLDLITDHKMWSTTMTDPGFDPWLPCTRQQNVSGFDGGNISESDEEYEITSDLD